MSCRRKTSCHSLRSAPCTRCSDARAYPRSFHVPMVRLLSLAPVLWHATLLEQRLCELGGAIHQRAAEDDVDQADVWEVLVRRRQRDPGQDGAWHGPDGRVRAAEEVSHGGDRHARRWQRPWPVGKDERGERVAHCLALAVRLLLSSLAKREPRLVVWSGAIGVMKALRELVDGGGEYVELGRVERVGLESVLMRRRIARWLRQRLGQELVIACLELGCNGLKTNERASHTKGGIEARPETHQHAARAIRPACERLLSALRPQAGSPSRTATGPRSCVCEFGCSASPRSQSSGREADKTHSLLRLLSCTHGVQGSKPSHLTLRSLRQGVSSVSRASLASPTRRGPLAA